MALKAVAVWNARAARKARPSFYPTLETAVLASTPWLSFMCPACQCIGEDLLRVLIRFWHILCTQLSHGRNHDPMRNIR
jgi:hypothetical protein